MSKLKFEDKTIDTLDAESVLDALIRHGHDIPHGCLAGACQSCAMVAESGDIPPEAQQGLSPAKVNLNYFLSCQCVADEPLSVRRIDPAELRIDAKVIDKTMLNDQVIRLRLKSKLAYQAGQYVTLRRDDDLGRSYSLASVPEQEDFLEFHIKLIENGLFSQWLYNDVQTGDVLAIQGPAGDSIFSAQAQQPILLTAIGTGLSPVYGIVKQALLNEHKGKINLVVAARSLDGFYLREELQALSDDNDNLTVDYVCQTEGDDEITKDDIYQFCKTKYADLTGWRVYLCGADSFVKKMYKQTILSGASMRDISADPFMAS